MRIAGWRRPTKKATIWQFYKGKTLLWVLALKKIPVTKTGEKYQLDVWEGDSFPTGTPYRTIKTKTQTEALEFKGKIQRNISVKELKLPYRYHRAGWRHLKDITPNFWAYRPSADAKNATHILRIVNNYRRMYYGRWHIDPTMPRNKRYTIELWTQGGWWGRDVKTRKPLKSKQYPLEVKHAATYKDAQKKAAQMRRAFQQKQIKRKK